MLVKAEPLKKPKESKKYRTVKNIKIWESKKYQTIKNIQIWESKKYRTVNSRDSILQQLTEDLHILMTYFLHIYTIYLAATQLEPIWLGFNLSLFQTSEKIWECKFFGNSFNVAEWN